MKKNFGAIICFMLLISMTSLVVSGEEIDEESVLYKLKSVNDPPKNPLITAPNEVIKNKHFNAKVISTDPNEDKIYYRFTVGEDGKTSDWGGPFDSGYEEKFRVRILFYTGNLVIGAQAKDEHGATSDWSYHTITYINPRAHNIFGSTLLTFLGRFFHLIN
jgi:hypothetical protein